MIFRHRFAPYGLPKAALPRIPDFSPVQHLLSVRFIAQIRIVGNGRGNFVFALIYEAGDVEIKRPIAARMTARNFAADVHATMLIRGAEVQKKALAPCRHFVEAYRPPVPQCLTRHKFALNAGEYTFGRKRNKDFAVPVLRHFFSVADCILPRTVQALPLFPFKLGARIVV